MRKKIDMDIVKIEIEHQLQSTSRNIVWRLISTPEGLARWIADSVALDGDSLTFGWGDTWRHHETRRATLQRMERYNLVRWHWDDDTDGTYVEIRMERSPVSGELTLRITDFAQPDDEEWLRSAWRHNFDTLHRRSGM